MSLSHIGSPGLGLRLNQDHATVYNRTGGAVVLGATVQFDHTHAQSETAGSGGAFANVIVPGAASATVPGIGGEVNATTVGQPGGFFGIVDDLLLDAGADNTLVQVTLRGRAQVLAPSGSTLLLGRHIFPASGVMTATAVLAKGRKSIGMALATSAANGALTDCFVNGIEGLGVAELDALV